MSVWNYINGARTGPNQASCGYRFYSAASTRSARGSKRATPAIQASVHHHPLSAFALCFARDPHRAVRGRRSPQTRSLPFWARSSLDTNTSSYSPLARWRPNLGRRPSVRLGCAPRIREVTVGWIEGRTRGRGKQRALCVFASASSNGRVRQGPPASPRYGQHKGSVDIHKT